MSILAKGEMQILPFPRTTVIKSPRIVLTQEPACDGIQATPVPAADWQNDIIPLIVQNGVAGIWYNYAVSHLEIAVWLL